MYYSDKKSEEEEKIFQEKLAAVKNYMANERFEEEARIRLVMEEGRLLIEKKTLTPDEIKRLDEIQEIMIERRERLVEIQQVLNEESFRGTSGTYHDIKKLAEETNDPELVKAYLNLKPHYLKKLRDNMNEN